MSEILQALITFLSSESALVRSFIALLIIFVGHLSIKIIRMVLKNLWIRGSEDLTKKDIENRFEVLTYFEYVLNGLVILGALIYLQAGITLEVVNEFSQHLPNIISAFLIGVLGIIVINITARLGSELITRSGFNNYFRDAGISSGAMNLIKLLIKGFLYLILLQVALSQLGIGDTFISELITASSWAAAFMVAGLVFYGFKDLFKNIAAGVYLKNSRLVRPGEEVSIDEDKGEIQEVSLFSTSVETDTGYTLLTPNSKIMDSSLKFRRTKKDIRTLEDMKKHFVAQHPSYCGPASMEMALDIFGYRHDQDEIGEKSGTSKGEGTENQPLMESVEELTDEEVKTAFVEYDKITDLADEFKAWFNDGALIVPNFYKPKIFPEATTGHYVLALGIESDDILIVDPSDVSGTGGVYYVSKDRLLDSMGDHGHKRGYIVVAPEGTTAYWRIENDLIYSDKKLYDKLSKTLESRLRKILRQGRILGDVTPRSVDRYMEKWRSEDKISRIWKPEEERFETSEDN